MDKLKEKPSAKPPVEQRAPLKSRTMGLECSSVPALTQAGAIFGLIIHLDSWSF